MRPSAKRIRGLDLLLRLGTELHSQRNFHRLLERIWRELTHVLEAERSSLFLMDDNTKELYSVIAQKSQKIRFPWGMGIAGKAAARGESILISEAYDDPDFNPEIDRQTGFRTRSVLAVPMRNRSGEIIGVAQVLNRLDGRPFDQEDCLLLEALAGMASVAIETVQLYEEQKRSTEAVVSAFLMALEMRDPQGRWHSQEVRAYSRAIAEEMGLAREEVRLIEWAAALHDIGKISIPDRILTKESSPTGTEWTEYAQHATNTRSLLEAMDFSGELGGVSDIAPYHHKKYRGGGFPKGPPDGDEVPLGARIICAADAFWNRINGRWGQIPLSRRDALSRLQERAGIDFDPDVVGALRRIVPRLERLKKAARLTVPAERDDGWSGS